MVKKHAGKTREDRVGNGQAECHAGDRGRRQRHQVSLLRQSGTPPEKLCRLDSGPVQRYRSANDSFNTVRALEKESRKRCQANVVLVPKSTTHSDEACRILQQQLGNNGRANCANQGSDYPVVLTASDPPPSSNIKEQGISFAAVEVPTRAEPSKEDSFWPFGPTGEEVASFDNSRFSAASEAPPARALGTQLSTPRKVRSRDWGFGTISPEDLQFSLSHSEPFSTSPAKRPSPRERRHRGLGPTSLVP